MDPVQFDRVARKAAMTTRRSALRSLGALSLVGALAPWDAANPALAGKRGNDRNRRGKNDDKNRNNSRKQSGPGGSSDICAREFRQCFNTVQNLCRPDFSCCEFCARPLHCPDVVRTGTICGDITIGRCDRDEGDRVCCHGLYTVDASIGCK